MFRYEYPVDAMLQRYKYAHLLTMAETLGQLMADSFTASSDATMPDIIIPMPLHRQRLQERGFNQAVEIAKVLSNRLGLTLDTKSCTRIKLAPPQVSLPLKQRVKNMRGAFNCESRMDSKRVALVDDVMTTGASLNELAKIVKSAGAVHVECWVVARTLPR
ncbi:MAG TPA: phosphoribosyltransferase family protein [Methylophilaceae bacterium]